MYPEFSAIENTRVARKKSRFFQRERNGLPKFRNRGQCYGQLRRSAETQRAFLPIARHEECLIPAHHSSPHRRVKIEQRR
jgi:hypothetical protein